MQNTKETAHRLDAADISRGITVPTRDGIMLSTNIHGAALGPLPVVLERTPYGKETCDQSERHAGMARALTRAQLAVRFCEAGFIYVVQDCRGTGQSGGLFRKYTQEAADTVDTINWIRSQAWCSGFIGMVGFSYGAACQVAALEFEKTIIDAACIDCGGFSDAYRSGIRQGGAFSLKQATWAYAQAIRDKSRAGDDAAVAALKSQSLQEWLEDGPWSQDHSPLQAAPAHRDNLATLWQAGDHSDFWLQPGLYKDPEILAGNDTAALFITSWFDTSLISTLDNFQAKSKSPQASSQLIIGPWSHGNRFTSVAGEADFGPTAIPETGLGCSLLEKRLGWLQYAFEQKTSNHPSPTTRIDYFEMGGGTGCRNNNGKIDHGGCWQSCTSWPPAHTRALAYTLAGDRLRAVFPVKYETERRWTSDPHNPVPTLGGAINSGEPVMSGGMFDQNVQFACSATDGASLSQCQRTDVLSFFTEPLGADIHIAGPITMELWIMCDQPDADITIKLIDCYPANGPAVNISDGILRLRYRDSWRFPQMMERDKPALITVMANPSANRFAAGHRIRVDIAASNFPNFDVNPQTGAQQGLPGQRQMANLTLVSSAQQPSRLLLTQRIHTT